MQNHKILLINKPQSYPVAVFTPGIYTRNIYTVNRVERKGGDICISKYICKCFRKCDDKFVFIPVHLFFCVGGGRMSTSTKLFMGTTSLRIGAMNLDLLIGLAFTV